MGETYHVHIMNGLQTNSHALIVRCKSKNDDLGRHVLWKDGDFTFHLKVNFWQTTLFFCGWNWGNKRAMFDVFKADDEGHECAQTGNCYWQAREDGFYFTANTTMSWVHKYNWNN